MPVVSSSCCGDKVDFSKLGSCRFCFALSIICLLLAGGVYRLCLQNNWQVLSSIMLGAVCLFALSFAAHTAAFVYHKLFKPKDSL